MLAVPALLTACSNDNESTPEQNEIRLKTNIRQMMEGTRATTIDNDAALQAEDLKIDAYYHDTETAYLDGVKLHYDSSWKFWSGSQVHYYWPIEGSVYDPASANITVSSLDFVGVCPFTAPGYVTSTDYDATDGVSFTADISTYMTNAAQDGVSEYLVAVLDNQTYDDQVANSGIPLQFKHPFALIKFTITAASGTNVQINSVSIADLYTTATCTYNGTDLEWSDHSGSAAITLAQTLKNGGTTEGTKFIVIPNDYGSKALTVNATWNDWSNPLTMNVSADVDFDWEPGYIYTYNLTLEKYALKVDIAKYTEQW